MKTLAVLFALAAVALAAPALLGEGPENLKHTVTHFPDTSVRERKSPHDASQQSTQEGHGPATSQFSELGVSGRSFALKKPIIIKKKQGLHHVYRDSDEEQAESGESCGKQVNVKLCDVKSENTVRSSTIEDTNSHMTEEDMKHSIKLAKEAVENLQRDLKTVERKPSTKPSAWKHGNSDSDAELHQDIEVAREALEHIHKNFGNLESMSLHATTLNDADTVQSSHFEMAKNEEQRLAQWKEAMDAIQKNVEIAKNIEDSFKSASGETGFMFSEDMTTDNSNHKLHEITDHKMRTADAELITKNENKVNFDNCKIEHKHEKASEKDNEKHGLIDDDMTSAASTTSEKKIKGFHNNEKARHVSELPTNTQIDKTLQSEKLSENSLKKKEVEDETITLENQFQKDSLVSDSMKKTNENEERKTEPGEKDNNKSLTGSVDNAVAASDNKMKSVESEDMLLEEQRNVAADDHQLQLQKSLKPDQHLNKIETHEKKHLEMKSAEQVNKQQAIINRKADKIEEAHFHEEQPKDVDTTMLIKFAENAPRKTQQEFLADTKAQENSALNDHLEHFTQVKQAIFEDVKQQSEPTSNSNHMQSQQHGQPLMHPEMRKPYDLIGINQHQLVDLPQTRWADKKEDNNIQYRGMMKSAEGIHSETMDHHHTMQHSGHHHHVHHEAHPMKNHHLDTPHGHGQLHPRFPDNFMQQGKSADMDMQSYYMSMRDGSSLGPDNQRFRWKPMHESARTAYGAPAAVSPPNGGAVGLFPTANVGGCGIPLLLSCNPSVVSGTLSKPNSASYTAPAYRTEDDFNLHSKRDVKKSHESLLNPLHRTPSNINLKTSTVLDAKQ